MQGLLVAILIVSALLCFIFAGLESGFFALNHLRVRQQMKAGNRRAAVLHGYISDPERYLRTILVGGAVTLVFAFSSGVALLHSWLKGPGWLLLAVGIATIWFCLLCRLFPKLLFRAYPNRLSIAFAPVFTILSWLFRPFVWATEMVTRLIAPARRLAGQTYASREELRLTMQE